MMIMEGLSIVVRIMCLLRGVFCPTYFKSNWVRDPDYLNLAGTTVKLIIWTGGQKRLSYTYTLGNLGIDNHDMISKEMCTCL